MRKNSCSVAANIVGEARTLATFLVEVERGSCGGDVDVALHRTASKWGVEEGALRSLRYRWRELQDVKGSILERLREAYETVYERQRRTLAFEREIELTVRSPARHLETADA